MNRKWSWKKRLQLSGAMITEGTVTASTLKDARRKATKESGTRNWGKWERVVVSEQQDMTPEQTWLRDTWVKTKDDQFITLQEVKGA